MEKKPINLIGRYKIMLFDEDGNLKEVREKDNVVVETGFGGLCRRISEDGTSVAAANWIAIGTGTSTATASDTSLAGGVSGASGYFTALGNETAASWQVVYTWGQGDPNEQVDIYESGVFYGTSLTGAAGTMLCRQTFGIVSKNTTDTLTVTWGFTIT